MNRRGFIGTITALAGVVLAKIKAPATEWRPGIATVAPTPIITHLERYANRFAVFTKSHVYIYTDKWEFITKNNLCPDCGHEAHPGYDSICMTPGCTRCQNGQCLKH